MVKPALLEGGVVVVVEVVETDDLVAPVEEGGGDVGADEAGRTGDENLHVEVDANGGSEAAHSQGSRMSSVVSGGQLLQLLGEGGIGLVLGDPLQELGPAHPAPASGVVY